MGAVLLEPRLFTPDLAVVNGLCVVGCGMRDGCISSSSCTTARLMLSYSMARSLTGLPSGKPVCLALSPPDSARCHGWVLSEVMRDD